MGKITSLIVGGVVTLIGVILLIAWWYEVIFVVKAILPGVLIFAGVIAIIAGIGEMKDVIKSSSKKK